MNYREKVLKQKRAIALFVSILLTAFLLSACGRHMTDVEPAATIRASNVAEQEAVATDTPDELDVKDPIGKYDPAIEMVFVRSIDDDIFTNILPNTPGETIEDNRWLKLYYEELGIHITYKWTVKDGYEADEYKQKINVTLASGDLPDVFFVDPSQLKQLSDSNMIADLTTYWQDYASDIIKQYYTAQGSGILGSSTFEGRLKGIMAYPDAFGDGIFSWIRSDWLDNLGLEAPENMNDVLEIAKAFTTQDPDGNGANDTYGLAVTKNLYSDCLGLEGFLAGFHAYPNMWVEDESGRLVYGSTLPAVKEALQVLADMYRTGQIDPEFGLKDISKAAESIMSGKIGLEYGAQWNPMYPLIGNYQNDPVADWEGHPLVSIDEDLVYSPARFCATLFIAVNKDYEYPEALIKLMNTHAEKCWGETSDFNRYYMPAENASVGVWKFSPVTPFPPYKNLDAFRALEVARGNGMFDELSAEAAAIRRNIEAYENGDVSQWGWYKIYGSEGVFRWGMEYQNNSQILLDKFTGVPTPTMVEKMNAIRQMEREVFIRIIMGAVSIDEFDKFVCDWYQIGGQDITDEVNEWYSSQSK